MRPLGINQFFGWVILAFTVVPAALWAERINYLLTPPSSEAVDVAHSFRNHPERWRADTGEVVFYNDAESIEVRRFGGRGSIQVVKNGKLVPTLDQTMRREATQNQFYVSGAIDHWLEATKSDRSASSVGL